MIFLTNGKRIEAINWKDARLKAKKLNLKVVGIWIADVSFETGKTLVNSELN